MLLAEDVYREGRAAFPLILSQAWLVKWTRLYRVFYFRKQQPKNRAKNRRKPQSRKKFHPKPKTEIKAPANKALAVFRISLSVIIIFFLHKNLFYFPNSKFYLRIPWLVQNTSWSKKNLFCENGLHYL